MKYYIGFNGVGHGHGARCKAIAQELIQRGQSVSFTTYNSVYSLQEEKVSSFSALLKNEGYSVFDGIVEMYGTLKNNMLDTYSTFIDAKNKFLKVLSKGTKEQLKQIKEQNPDVVVSDGHVSTVIAAKFLKKPHFLILNQNSIRDLVKIYEEPFAKALLGYLQQGARAILVPDLKPPDTICGENLQSYGKKVDSKITYIGPILRREVSSPKVHQYEARTIFVCMGGQNKISLENHLSIASRRLGIEFLVVNSSVRSSNNGINHLPYQQNPIPYMKGAWAIITHGGHNTLMEALACGVPVIGITQEKQERYQNIMGLQKRDLGRLVMVDAQGCIDEEKFLEAIKDVTQNGYIDTAREFSKKIEQYDGAKTAADILTSKI